jgi:hypothetical protein
MSRTIYRQTAHILATELTVPMTSEHRQPSPASPSSVQYRRSPTPLPQASIDLILELCQRLRVGSHAPVQLFELRLHPALARCTDGFLHACLFCHGRMGSPSRNLLRLGMRARRLQLPGAVGLARRHCCLRRGSWHGHAGRRLSAPREHANSAPLTEIRLVKSGGLSGVV